MILSREAAKNLYHVSGSISLFEAYSFDKGIHDKNVFEFLRNVQNLRSMDVAHRKKSNDKERQPLIQYFGLDSLSEQDILNSIFAKLIQILEKLENDIETITE